MPGKAFSRGVRKLHIMQVFLKRFEDEEPSEMTSVQVARSLNLEPSFHIRGLLAELVSEGSLKVRKVIDNRGQNLKVGQGGNAPKSDGGMYLFSLSDKARADAEKKVREVPVKVNGKQAGQLRLF